MRNLVALAWVVISASVLAADNEKPKDPCLWTSTIAESIMKARQKEQPMADVMSVFNKGDASEEVRKFMKQLVIAAYEQPAMSVPENQAKAVARFQNEVYLECVKRM